MDLSTFIAQLLGLIYVVVGFGILADQGRYRALFDDILRSPHFMYLSGLLSLIAGFLIVTFHSIWVKDWPLIITLIGWLALIKGMLILVTPKIVLRRARFWLQRMQLAGMLTLVLGLILGYFGFVA